MICLAGHGANRGAGFHCLTADAETAELSDPNERETTALPSADLVEAVKQIPAHKQVLILDTCASGGFLEALTGKRAVPSSPVRALDRVKDRTGMLVLGGCASDRVSYEATPYGQGLLTCSLLLGMKGGSLRENQYVDVSPWFNFAADKVPEFARDIGGVQRPIVAAPRGGSSFDIGRLTEAEKASVFVDVPRFPGACRIAGAYTTEGVVTRVRFRLRRGTQAVTDWIPVRGREDEVAAVILEATRSSLPARGR